MSEMETGAAPAAPAPQPIANTPAPEPAPAPEAPSMDDTLNAAWDKIQVNGADRGEGGKFTPGDKLTAETKQTDSAVQPTTEAQSEPAQPAIEAPQSWTAEAKANWGKLPPEVQDYVLKRESESHKAITSQGERIKSYEPLEKVITEYRNEFAKHSMPPDQGIRILLEAQRMLDADPLGGLVAIARTYGIDLQAVLNGQPGAAPAFSPEVSQLRQELAQIKNEQQQYLESHRASQEAADFATVKEFAKDKPYFDDVRTLMASYLKDGHAETLQSAYEMAVKAHPTVSKRIEADQRKADEAKRKADDEAKQAELKKRAEDAAKSARVNVKSGTPINPSKTMDDTLQEIARRHYG